MRLTLFVVLVVSCLRASAQVDLAPGFRVLYEQKLYDRITGYQAGPGELMSAKALYYIAMAYFMKEDDRNALRYFDEAIAKGPADADMYYYKGMTLLYAKKPADALPSFGAAIGLQPDVADFWAGKGEAFIMKGQKDSAQVYFEQSVQRPSATARTWLRLGDLYNGLNAYDKARDAYTHATEVARKGSDSWKNALFNLGLTEYLSGMPAPARDHFLELLDQAPDDYKVLTKLAQCYYALGDYANGKAVKERLYDAWRNKKLPKADQDMFCFDQFLWNGRRVVAFERYDIGGEFLKVKWLFYVLDSAGKVDYRVQAESSPAVEMAGKDAKYVLCLVQGGSYSTYWDFVFNDNVAYADLKKAVVQILDGKSKPGSATRKGGDKGD